MTGKLRCERVSLDYTEVAAPLDMDKISKDIQECCARHVERPSELVMWEHQLDWLAKPYADRGRRSSYWSPAEDAPVHPRAPEIFGVPVRLA